MRLCQAPDHVKQEPSSEQDSPSQLNRDNPGQAGPSGQPTAAFLRKESPSDPPGAAFPCMLTPPEPL